MGNNSPHSVSRRTKTYIAIDSYTALTPKQTPLPFHIQHQLNYVPGSPLHKHVYRLILTIKGIYDIDLEAKAQQRRMQKAINQEHSQAQSREPSAHLSIKMKVFLRLSDASNLNEDNK